MKLSIITVFLSLMPLIWVFYVLWKGSKHFHSLIPFIYGAIFIILARLMDVPIEVPSLQIPGLLGFSRQFLDSAVIVIGDFADTIGVVLLVLGFIRTIEIIQTSEKKIETLESLLPICAWCKKIRSKNGAWQPVEQYLQESGSPDLTHGICPECAVKITEDRRERQNRRTN